MFSSRKYNNTTVLILLMSLIILCSCRTKPEIKNNELSVDLNEFLLTDYNQATQILSIKHSIPLDISQNITTEYIKTYNSALYDIIHDTNTTTDPLKPKEEFSVFINRLSTSYNLEPDIISSYIFDLIVFIKIS